MNSTESNMAVSQKGKKRYCKVYESIISNYFTFNNDLISSAKEILNSKKERKDFKTDLLDYQLAFLLSFGVQDTCTAAQAFYKSVKNQSSVMKKLSQKNPIKLLCLESESLPAVIGVCHAIDFIINEFGSAGHNFGFSTIEISVIEYREKWMHLCRCIIDTVNSYFLNIELKLDFVKDYFTNLSSQEFADRIAELDLMIIARFFEDDRCFTENYSNMKVILREMKEGSIIFYFDSCNERYYENLKQLTSKTSFSELKTCQKLTGLFKDLGNELYYLDLPISWDTDFQPVMYSTWMKVPIQNDSLAEVYKSTESNQLSSTTVPNDLDIFEVNRHIPFSEGTKYSKKAKKTNRKKKNKSSSKDSNESTSLNELVNIVDGKNNCSQSNLQSEQTSVAIGQTEIEATIEPSKEFYSRNTQIKRKQKIKSSTSTCKSDFANKETTKARESKTKSKSHIHKSHEMIDNLLSFLNKQTIDSGDSQTSQKSKCSNILREAKTEYQKICSKEFGCRSSDSSASQTAQPKNKTRTATPINSISAGKTISKNQKDENVLLKQSGNGNLSTSILEAMVCERKKSIQASEKSFKNNSDSKTTASEEEFKTKSGTKKSSVTATSDVQTEAAFSTNKPKKSSKKNATLTKRSVKNHAVEKIKLTGKFAHKDLEKKNKDERHKMRAKNASFAKHANFDYDD